jgi:sterol desaturase/sphingolipid hydroxylase (fatty acid hydroxylase superfamily)
MRLSKVGYFADFFIYPWLVLALLAGVAVRAGALEWVYWSVACAVGVAAWTLIEYVVHRSVLHEIRPFVEMHDMHHDSPADLVGTPTWMTLSIACFGVLLPLWWATGLAVGGGLTAGLTIGYLWFGAVHHAIHHWEPAPGSYLFRAKRRHLIHHYSRQPCNFGVTVGFWDSVFGTARATR